ncbi:DDHD domain-containing protein [Scheffersomyces amazonensis]|uniref:DDHD domain-containing protein n=1 Tax=Scheffersomyces amazonensis TaxID=1078765 RepID=UPI00315D9293
MISLRGGTSLGNLLRFAIAVEKVVNLKCVRDFSSGTIIAKSTDSAPKARVKWYYATDVPISKPEWFNYQREKEPEKFLPFSDYDSSKLENEYQKSLAERDESKSKVKLESESESASEHNELVEVNEDKLFQVNLVEFTLSPVYWDGPIYEVRRGTWFGTDGIPLPMNVSQLIEKGYRDMKPYLFEKHEAEKPNKEVLTEFNKLKDQIREDFAAEVDISQENDLLDLQNGNWVLFYDDKDAVMFPATMNSKYQVGVIRKFGPSPISLISVTPIKRGYTDDLGESIIDKISSNVPSLTDTFQTEFQGIFSKASTSELPSDDKVNREHKGQLETDYDHDTSGKSSNREIDHLILCIHGIGQVLGPKYESVNFTHSINVLRHTMKSVFQSDDSYQKLAYPNGSDPDMTNNRIQVLPISWRHKVDFHPNKPFKVLDKQGNPKLPTLSQINVDGVKSLRNMVGDVALDILLYYEPHYAAQIFEAVISELNRVYKLYKKRNPNFKGKVHILGHSLGSAISFDIVSKQSVNSDSDIDVSGKLDFDVENLFCVGCPVGVFKLLEQKNIVAPSLLNKKDHESYASPTCTNLYNIFHPCDPIGYRMEPLVSPQFAQYKAEPVGFAVKGFNTQIKELASISDGISEKIYKASGWFSRKDDKTTNENALRDIVTSVSFGDRKKPENKHKSQKVELSGPQLQQLTELNRTGRVDYCLPMGVFDFSLISAVSAHISYFEDMDTAGFILREVLSVDKAKVHSKIFMTVN